MFPTFISILDIQSWWEVPSIAHFCSLFRTAFNLLDFDIEDLEEALLTDGTEETSWLQELIVRLLTGCLPNNEISTFNYQMFLRRLFREKCKEHDRYNPFNTDIDFQLLPLRTKVDILHALCDFRLDAEDVLEQLKNLEADSLRVEPLGYDNNDSAYWYFYGTRLYREDFKTKNNKKGKSVWQVVCFTEDDWFQLAKKFKKSQSKSERQLYRTLTENFLPELPRLFCEKERLARKRLLENQPRRTSSRLDTKRKQEQIEQAKKTKLEPISEQDKEVDELQKKKDLERRRQEAYERRARLRERDQPPDEDQEQESEGEKSKGRYEMAGNKKRDKKSKIKPRQNSNSSSSSRDRGSSITRSSTRGPNRSSARNAEKTSTSASSTKSSTVSGSTAVGRQTNNSLASATGQIVIQPVSNPHRKKLKTSQVFCQTDEDLQTGMHKILDYVKNHEDAWPFVDPVEEEFAPNYYSIIRKPMDLQRMEERLDSGYYKSFSRFRGDFQLIVDNCRLYNGVDNEYTEMVGNLLTVFEKATERYLDQVTSSDEEIAVEYPEAETDEKVASGKPQKKTNAASSTSPRKPTLVAQTDKKRESSISEDSVSKRSNSLDSADQPKNEKKQAKTKNVEEAKPHKKTAKPPPKTEEKQNKKKNKKISKVGRKPARAESPIKTRSRSRSYSSFSRDGWSSSPPPSWPPSSPDSHIGATKRKNTKSSHLSDEESHSKFKGREKQKDKWKDVIKDDFDKRNDKRYSKAKDRSPTPPKQKDKHNKLRETIEKLKAKSEISNKLKDKDGEDSDNDKAKENRISSRDLHDNKNKKYDSQKNLLKNKAKRTKNDKRSLDFEDENSTADSIQSDNKKHIKKDNTKNSGTKNAAIEALTLATEQTLKDINKWLDDTPRLSEFSSASNSPSHYIGAEEFDSIGSKIEHDYRKRLDKPLPKKDGIGKDIKRRTFHRDPTKFLKKREVQRTIDRLQPGKSKGNLLSNIQNTNKADDIFPLGPLSKIKDTKNALIVKTDESTPKLSLGSVLDSFGKHKFVDDVKKEEETDKNLATKKEPSDSFVSKFGNAGNSKSETIKSAQVGEKKEEKSEVKVPVSETGPGKATPNLSAWFKAFGAPKVPPNQKKTDPKLETKDEKSEETSSKQTPQEQKAKEESRKIAPPDISPNPDSPVTPQGQPAQRQRKMSTGSTVSERSSFSQDMDSPRIGIDERLGAYPAPYPSPLHRSPSGASPVMASPRPDVSPKATYPTVNGQIRVGFYQDTVSTKSSPDKSCSPRDNPQSPYPQYSEHVYTPSTTESATYAYNNPSYYSQIPNYSNSTTSSYNPEQTNPPSYYDTNKPLTDQYQAKAAPSYHTVNSPNFQNVNSPNYSANSPSYHSANSPSYHPTNSPASSVTQLPSPAAQQPASYEAFRQQQPARLPDKQQTAMFPVKKRAYNESDPPQLPNVNQQQEQPGVYDRNFELSLMSGRQLTIGTTNQPPQAQDVRPSSRSTPQQYVHQNIPNPRAANPQTQNSTDTFTKTSNATVQPSNPPREAVPPLQQTNQENMHNVNSFGVYNYNSDSAYPINVPSERPLDLNARPDGDKKMDMSKYTNMGYTGADIGFARNPPQYNRVDLNYGRSAIPSLAGKAAELQTPPVNPQNTQNSEMMMRYSDAADYRNADMNQAGQKAVTNLNMPQNTENRLDVTSGYKPEMSIPRPGYSTATGLNVDQSLGLRGNLTNISHIVDRFSTENMYYSEKGLAAPHIYSKPMVTSASNLPMFSQPAMAYGHDMQATQSSMYNRQITELQNSMSNQSKTAAAFPQQQQQEKKSKRRKSSKAAATPTSSVETAVSSASNQGFQSYTGLKNTPAMEPSAISLKTASVVPGSAFNFGPAPTGLGLSSGLYGDKDTYPNFLEDYRTAPNYYMAAAAAAAHHRSTPDTGDKQARTAHQPSASAAAGYPFIGAPQPRPPSYPLSGPFMPPHQGPPLMDASSPLYQQYLQAGVLHQGLLGPPGAYPPGYHPALSMRQPFDSMTRPSWL